MRLRKRQGSKSSQKGSRRTQKRNPIPIRNALNPLQRNGNFEKGGTKMNNGYDVNQALQSVFQMRNAGRNPQQILQMLIQRNPQYSQMLTQIRNMSQGRNPQEFVIQLARQNGVSEQNLAQLMQMFGK
jgi:type VI protein secretion system component VasF